MPRRENIEIGEISHTINRGVENRLIYNDDTDYLRFIRGLFECNNSAPVKNTWYFFRKNEYSDPRLHYKRELLVEILCFTLLPNHFHLLLRQIVEGGIESFMRKLGTGYAKYFNARYERSGVLFQGRYKSVHIDTPEQFEYVPYYIHANPLGLKYPEWREGKIESAEKAMQFMENYRWSSFPDYIGKTNFRSVTQCGFLQERLTGGPEEYKQKFRRWLEDFQNNKEKFEEFEI